MATLELVLNRTKFNDKRTIGELFANGRKLSDTLEDTLRELPKKCPETSKFKPCVCPEKVYGQTCIPAGRYRVRYLYSNRFKRKYPCLQNVPHFLGILIHAGSNENHTEGCILVGTLAQDGQHLTDTFAARERVCKIVEDAEKSGLEVWITIKNEK